MAHRGSSDIDDCNTENESESLDKIILNEADLNDKKKEKNFPNSRNAKEYWESRKQIRSNSKIARIWYHHDKTPNSLWKVKKIYGTQTEIACLKEYFANKYPSELQLSATYPQLEQSRTGCDEIETPNAQLKPEEDLKFTQRLTGRTHVGMNTLLK